MSKLLIRLLIVYVVRGDSKTTLIKKLFLVGTAAGSVAQIELELGEFRGGGKGSRSGA